MSFDKCIYLGNHCHNQVIEHYLSPQMSPVFFKINPRPRQPVTIFTSVQVVLPILELIYLDLYNITLWHLASFALHKILRFIQVVACINNLFLFNFILLFPLLLNSRHTIHQLLDTQVVSSY